MLSTILLVALVSVLCAACWSLPTINKIEEWKRNTFLILVAADAISIALMLMVFVLDPNGHYFPSFFLAFLVYCEPFIICGATFILGVLFVLLKAWKSLIFLLPALAVIAGFLCMFIYLFLYFIVFKQPLFGTMG